MSIKTKKKHARSGAFVVKAKKKITPEVKKGKRKNIFIVTFDKYCCSLMYNGTINNCPFLGPTEEQGILGCALWHTKLVSDNKDKENRPVRYPRCISVYR